MKPLLSTIILAGALLALSGCSDEPGAVPDNTKPVGQQVFMDIDLRSAPDSRAYEFADGSEDEHRVYCARFYFFDEDGLYYGQASKWSPSGATEPDNVEHMGKSTVVLDNVGSNKYPAYLLTVLNAPAFSPKTTLEETSKTLMDLSSTIDGEKYYVMSTSSFRGTPKTDPQHYGDAKYYYATKLHANDFKLTATDATANPVVVYVERLAAKIELKMKISSKPNENGVYPVNISVMGNPNDEGGDTEAATELGVKILGWDFVDAKAKNYLSKQLDDSWTAGSNTPFTGWTEPNRYRSYWAKPADYGVEGRAGLNTKTYDALSRTFGDENIIYTHEYTNKLANITATTESEGMQVIVGRVPHIIIKARLCDKTGKGQSLIRWNGYFFTPLRFKQYILSTINKDDIKVYFKNSAGQYEQPSAHAHYKFILASQAANESAAFKKVVEDHKLAGTGRVVMYPNFPDDGRYTYYTKNAEGAWTTISRQEALDLLNPVLAAAQTVPTEAFSDGGNSAMGGGAMYYVITIDHNPDFEDSQDGKYGIVRNHWYEITINDIVNIGHAVWDPHHEVIEPEYPKDDRYSLAAQIKVLSWRIVDKVVDL